jgi:regulatory protein
MSFQIFDQSHSQYTASARVHIGCHKRSGKLLYIVQPRKIVRKLAAEELFQYAVRYLGLRACSSDELRAKLRPRAALLADIDSTIARLSDIGYLNDQRFAENYAAARLENDGFGRMRVLSDLRSRRVPGKLAEKAVEQTFEGKGENELIDAFIKRRLPSLIGAGPIEDDRILARAYRRLRRAGFSSGGSLAALKRMAARPELIEEPPAEEGETE